jgi:endonuclease/exonuclease/phosphatase family metal-dependent hydrolase
MNLFAIIIQMAIPSLSFSQSISVLTYNIRYDNPDDGKNAWVHRKNEMVKFLRDEAPDLMGFQEVLNGQLEFLKEGLSKYQSFGVGREDGKLKGEFSPIFFKKEKFELLNQETIWLSETPDKPGIGWDAALERIATLITLRMKDAHREVVVINTHYDHRGVKARSESSKLLLNIIEDRYQGKPLIVMGDLNSDPDALPVKIFSPNLTDTFHCIKNEGPDITFSGFANVDYTTGQRIDYIFTRNFNCISFQILTPTIVDRNLSDHLPLVAIIEFR